MAPTEATGSGEPAERPDPSDSSTDGSGSVAPPPGLQVAPTELADQNDLYHAFARLVADDEGFPQHPDEPLSFEDFRAYVARLPDRQLAGAYTMRPNGVGRAAHVVNVGYFVVAEHRGTGVGEHLVRHSMDAARSLGFDAMQFNFVFESNPARSLYERLGFREVGRVPEVIGPEAVYIYWRKL